MKKPLYRILQVALVFLLSFHLGLFANVLIFGFTIGPRFPLNLYQSLSAFKKILFVILYFVGIPGALMFSIFIRKMENLLSATGRKQLLRLFLVDFVLLILFLSPFYYTYEGSFFSNLSPNERVRYLIIFLIVVSLVLYLVYFYLLKWSERKRDDLMKNIERLHLGNRKLSKEIKSNKAFIRKTKDDLIATRDEFEAISDIPPEIEEYYLSLTRSFAIIEENQS